MLTTILSVCAEGLVYAIMALGVYITYKILDFPDLSVDGTFPLGAAVTASLILLDVPPVLTLFISLAAGAFAGIITGLIHVKCKVRDLLSGIIVMTALYSLNLRIAGSANKPIFTKDTIFENEIVRSIVTGKQSQIAVVLILLVIVIVLKVLMDLFFKTKAGYLLRAVGDNSTLVTSLAKDQGTVKIMGLAIANGLAGLAGSVYCQMNGFFEISSGTGTIVIGLANVIIGINLFMRIPGLRNIIKPTTAVVLGSILYKACVSIALHMGFAASDLKLITAALFFIILIASHGFKKGAN